jgi:glycogen debranching enzyme
LRRYGFASEAALLIREESGAGSFFDRHQMPELYAGVQRSSTNFPIQYLGANVPQAWAVGSAFAFLQVILGVHLDAPRDMLYLDPWLPDWLPDLLVEDLRIGHRQFDLRFWRDSGVSRWEVTKGDANRVVQRSFSTGPFLNARGDPIRAPASVE